MRQLSAKLHKDRDLHFFQDALRAIALLRENASLGANILLFGNA